MNATFFSPRPWQGSSPAKPNGAGLGSPRVRRWHRGIAIIVALAVVANFVAMVVGRPPAGITFAPLPPLLLLLTTGLVMLVVPWITFRQAGRRGEQRGVPMSDPVTLRIDSLGDWRGALLVRIREAIRAADPRIVEEIKWRKATNPLGVPTWSLDGIICTGESYRDKVKLTFINGRALDDVAGLFNVPGEGARRRSIAGRPTASISSRWRPWSGER